ncbi:DUF1427 family protein [Caulobacter sp. SSI4214]|uniref:DUF1427 family protein n=1 Tax=Caulobacter sp. SSI4214 TaxID=2575739 RepID=UPI001439561D|nr:DUF1427 family protein [Caulobacter sp. SSI4214]
MKPYLLSLAVGLMVGVIYALLGVRSPAPPAIALLGLLGMLLGERIVPAAKALIARPPVEAHASEPERAGPRPGSSDPQA